MEMKNRKKAAETAENRMAMIAPLLAPNLSREDVTNMKERISESFQVSVRTLERYCKSYLEYGFEGLYPQGKSAESKYKIPKELLDEAIRLRRELPSRSVPTIIRILELEGKAEPGFLRRTTLQDAFAPDSPPLS